MNKPISPALTKNSARYFAQQSYQAFAYRGKDRSTFRSGDMNPVETRVFFEEDRDRATVEVWDNHNVFTFKAAKSWVS